MSQSFSDFVLPEIGQPRSHRMVDLAQGLPKYDAHSLPSVEKVLQTIADGRAEELTLIDWLFCIIQKARWDETHQQEHHHSAAVLWKAALNFPEVQANLLRRLAWYRSKVDTTAIAPSFSETFANFRESATGNARLASELIELLEQRNSEFLIPSLIYQENLTPKELRLKLANYIPSSIPAIQSLSEQCVPYFISLDAPTLQHVEWLTRCLNEMAEKSQAKAVTVLLTAQDSTLLAEQFPLLVEWLQNTYGWRSSSSRWYLLSDAGKDALRKWIGSVNYGDFERLVNQTLTQIPLPDWQRNQLERRKSFWANYSDRFERIRILLPESSVKLLGDKNFPQNDILLNDGSEPTEICIFDFGEWFVVEFFRGPGSETRLFQYSDAAKNKEQLFTSSNLSVHRLRFLGSDRHDYSFLWQEQIPHAPLPKTLRSDRHDHSFLWQGYCERWLHKNGIYPNEGVTQFQGLGAAHGRYDRISGLPQPSTTDLLERKRKLERWETEIKKLEQQAKDYCIKHNWSWE
jgi:EH_Signature domain